MIDESIKSIREFVEKLEEEIYKPNAADLTVIPISLDRLELQLEKGINVEIYRVETGNMDVYVEFIKRMGKNCSVDMAYSTYIPPFIDELIYKEKRKIKERKEEKVSGIIRIYLTVKDPYKSLRDILKECEHLKSEIYSECFHERAHLELYKKLSEKELEKYKELLNKLGEYGEKIGLVDLENRKKSFSELAKFYKENVLPLSTLSEIYAHSAEILGIVQLLKEGKISIDDARNIFTKKLYAFSRGTLEFIGYIGMSMRGYSERSFEELKELDSLVASFIIYSFLLRELKGNIFKLINNFEENIDTIEKLFKELIKYAEKNFWKN
jgi:hypothetical protein